MADHQGAEPAGPARVVGVIEALSRPSSQVQRLLELATTWSEPDKTDTSDITQCRTARQLGVDEIDGLVAAFEAGAKVPELARQFGVYRGTVSRYLLARGIDPKPEGQLACTACPR